MSDLGLGEAFASMSKRRSFQHKYVEDGAIVVPVNWLRNARTGFCFFYRK